jgi:AcrR family transcriptional regulator
MSSMSASNVPGMIWTEPATGGTRTLLSREKVVRAAIDLLDADGISGLSMRKLGTELGAPATTLYWHVNNKQQLLDLAFDEVMGELPEPLAAATGDWRTDIVAAMNSLRAMMLRHRWYPALFSTRPSVGPRALHFWAGFAELFGRAGFSGAAVDHAFCMISDYVVGTTAIQVSYDQWQRSGAAALASIHRYVLETVSQYPTYEGRLKDYIAVTDPDTRRDQRFAFALERMLDGLAVYLAAPTGTAEGEGRPLPDSPSARRRSGGR